MLRITVVFNDATIQLVETEKNDLSIGRAYDNDIIIDNLGVSQYHARVYREDDHYIVEDLNSTNGTLYEGRKIQSKEIKKNIPLTIRILKYAIHFNLSSMTKKAQPVTECEMVKTPPEITTTFKL